MAFIETQLDPDISYGAVGGPVYSTTIIQLPNGSEQRIARKLMGLLVYKIDLDTKSKDQMEDLIAFYRAMKGRLDGFRFKDWSDYKAVDEELVNGGTATLQLIKTYTGGTNTEVRTIFKPVTGTVTMKRDTVAFTDFTIDYTTGVITLTGGADPGHTYTWSGEFDVPVRFDTDEMQVTVSDFNIRDWSVTIREIYLA